MTKKTVTEHTSPSAAGTALFPSELLLQPWELRHAYFEQQLFRHPILDRAKDALVDAIMHPCGRRTINLYGPTGVGKTTLLRLMKEHFIATASAIQERGYSQPLFLDAKASDARRFGWKDFYRLWSLSLHQHHPEVDIDFGIPGIRCDPRGRLVIEARVNTESLRRFVTTFTRLVKPLAIFIDETPHLKKLASGERIAHQMDVMKSLTDETETVFVLSGTYELLNMINQNGQQGRRSRDIHLRRYQPGEEDQKAFLRVLQLLQRHMPIAETPNLAGMADYLYKVSVGCIGVLKPWLDETLFHVLKSNKSTMTRKGLEKHAPQKAKLLQIGREIFEGERELQRLENECDQLLDTYLGLVPSK